MNLTPRNLQEYVVKKIIEYNDEKDKEITMLKAELKNKDKLLKQAKSLLRAQDICFQCICDHCKRKIPPDDMTHSHNAHPVYSTLCYRCFFIFL